LKKRSLKTFPLGSAALCFIWRTTYIIVAAFVKVFRKGSLEFSLMIHYPTYSSHPKQTAL